MLKTTDGHRWTQMNTSSLTQIFHATRARGSNISLLSSTW